jgi:hypothetical protein
MQTTLISLISDQTIPNVQFIKEKQVDNHIFVTTKGMETKGLSDWIIKACNLNNDSVKRLEVEAFSYDDVQTKLENKLNDEIMYLVNLTGGTKIMSLAVNDLMRDYNAEIYYLAGNKEYMKIFPGKNKSRTLLLKNLSLEEYLHACGFEISKNPSPSFGLMVAQSIFHYYLNSFNKEIDINPLVFLFTKRDKNVASIVEVQGLDEFLKRIGFVPSIENQLSKIETKYLTGDWFEEFFFYRLKEAKNLDDNAIATGCVIRKNNIPNEFDILFIESDQLKVVECKTFIWKDVEEKQTLLGETIYKLDSLKNKFGLFASPFILTLSDLSSSRLKEHLERAADSRVKIFGRIELSNLNTLLKAI